jgi:hypothetical protein
MKKISRRFMLFSSTAVVATAVANPRPGRAQAAAYGPDDLKSTLTPLGGERAGNAAGTIPAWDGGYSTLPAGYQPGDPRPVPFADEKPLFSITGANLGSYKDKLPDGAIQLLTLYADYRIDVYPTHRTASAPQYVYDFTYKNAGGARLSADGNSITNAYGGTPFPIPTNGHHIIWNHLLAWKGTSIEDNTLGYTSTSNGDVVFGGKLVEYVSFPYYYPDGEADFSGFYVDFTTKLLAPANVAGGATLSMQPVNTTLQAPRNFQYLVGQRRVREAPQLQYDTPNYFSNGIGNFDEFQMFFGPLDDYDFNLIGKKEMYVPYNMNKALTAPAAQQLLGHFYSPDFSRWELHRVWVVEMTVKAGKRNVDAKRTMYFDEDTWNALLSDIYDSTGALWKFEWSIPYVLADIPCVLGSTTTIQYDFHAGVYAANQIFDSSIRSPWKPIPRLPDSFYTPGQLAAQAGGY